MNFPKNWDELFSGEDVRPKTALSRIFLPGSLAVLGVGLACTYNFATRRPAFSGEYFCDVTFF